MAFAGAAEDGRLLTVEPVLPSAVDASLPPPYAFSLIEAAPAHVA